MSDQQAVIVRQPIQTKLSQFGSRSELRELVDRIQRTIFVTKNGSKHPMTVSEAMHMAEISLMTGLSPWAQELYAFVGKDGSLNIGPGRNGWTKAAGQQLQHEGGGNYWPEFVPLTDEAERELYLVPQGAVAFTCHLYDTPSIREYSQAVERLSKAGAPWREIVGILGNKPYTLGVGWHTPLPPKDAWKEKDFPPVKRAQKRAFCDALKKRFHLPFDVPDSSDELPEEYSGEMTMGDDEPLSRPIIDQGQAEEPEGADGLAVAHQPAPPAPSAPVQNTPHDAKPKAAKLQISKHADWQRLCAEFVKVHPEYQTQVKGKPNGQPNMFHILGAVGACGFSTVTDANMETVIEQIAARAKAKANESEKAEEPF